MLIVLDLAQKMKYADLTFPFLSDSALDLRKNNFSVSHISIFPFFIFYNMV